MPSLETGINPSPLAFPGIVFRASAEDLPQPSAPHRTAPHNDQAVNVTRLPRLPFSWFKHPTAAMTCHTKRIWRHSGRSAAKTQVIAQPRWGA